MAFSILTLINALSPKPRGTRRFAHGLAYGSNPRQTLDIYSPVKAQGPLPLVYFIYGGSWDSGNRSDYGFVGRALAAQGFVSVIADNRLIPEVEYPVFLDDCAEGIAFAIGHAAEYGGDPRVFLMGHSAGAYNAVMQVLDPRYLKARGVLERIKGVIGLSGPYDFLPLDVKETLRAFGAASDLKGTQPVNLVGSDTPPMFLATGSADKLVYPRNTAALARSLRQFDRPVVERYYEGLGHPSPLLTLGPLWRHTAPVLAEVADFIRQHAN